MRNFWDRSDKGFMEGRHGVLILWVILKLYVQSSPLSVSNSKLPLSLQSKN